MKWFVLYGKILWKNYIGNIFSPGNFRVACLPCALAVYKHLAVTICRIKIPMFKHINNYHPNKLPIFCQKYIANTHRLSLSFRFLVFIKC